MATNKQRLTQVLKETEAAWKRRFAAIQKDGTAELRREQRALAEKMNHVKAALRKRFEAGLQPILDKASATNRCDCCCCCCCCCRACLLADHDCEDYLFSTAHPSPVSLISIPSCVQVRDACATEAAQHTRLRQEIAARERLAEAVIDDTHELQRCIADVDAEHPNEAAAVRERDELLAQLQRLWQDTHASADDIASFFSDLDLMAPFNEAVLRYYERKSSQQLL